MVSIIISIWQTSKLYPLIEELKKASCGHAACKWQSWDLAQVSLMTKSLLLATVRLRTSHHPPGPQFPYSGIRKWTSVHLTVSHTTKMYLESGDLILELQNPFYRSFSLREVVQLF